MWVTVPACCSLSVLHFHKEPHLQDVIFITKGLPAAASLMRLRSWNRTRCNRWWNAPLSVFGGKTPDGSGWFSASRLKSGSLFRQQLRLKVAERWALCAFAVWNQMRKIKLWRSSSGKKNKKQTEADIFDLACSNITQRLPVLKMIPPAKETFWSPALRRRQQPECKAMVKHSGAGKPPTTLTFCCFRTFQYVAFLAEAGSYSAHMRPPSRDTFQFSLRVSQVTYPSAM